MNRLQDILRPVGSLWFAGVLLILVLVAMACATVFESIHGTEQALAIFYRSRWFELLLALVAVNLSAAVVLRYPFAKRQIGFVVTHLSILMVMGGALVTKHLGVDGRVGIAEGQTVDRFQVSQPTLTLLNRKDRTHSSVELKSSVFDGFDSVDFTEALLMSLGNVTVEVQRYLADSIRSQRMVDDNPYPQWAVEVSLSPQGTEHPVWVFTEQTRRLGPVAATLRRVPDQGLLARMLSQEPEAEEPSQDLLKVEHQGVTYTLGLDDCLSGPVPVGRTGYTVKVLRYLPHATVGPDNQVINASNQPVNPAIETEIVGPAGTETRLAFARFPDFTSLHGKTTAADLKLVFVAAASSAPQAPIEILAGPDAETYVRFSPPGGPSVSHRLAPGVPVESPWPGLKFAMLRRFDHARNDWTVLPAEPVRERRAPAVQVRVRSGGHTHATWVQKYQPTSLSIEGIPYQITFDDKYLPLGFNLTLDDFHVGYYPGERKPRSFESRVTILDAAGGRTRSAVVSMNHPVEYGGYSFYQSSYRQEGDRSISYLSVSRDPGRPVVFAGYILMMIGMVWTLVTRAVERRSAPIPGVSISADDRAGPGTASALGRDRAPGGKEAGGHPPGRRPVAVSNSREES